MSYFAETTRQEDPPSVPLEELTGSGNVSVCLVISVVLKFVRAIIGTRLKYVYHITSIKGNDQKLNICGAVKVKSEGAKGVRNAAGRELSVPIK